jgi:undecaprenyl pyrophosphate phosphatase UppP
MSAHLTYLEAVVTGLVQGVTELFPVSSLGHNVLLPALIGGNWASALSVSAPNSPYLAFIVGLHVATAVAMIAYFWRDWLRIVRGFFSSITQRRVETPDERLAWMIILGTIPVGIVGLLVQKEFTKVFARPELAALFLAVNGVILLVSERMRRTRKADGAGAPDAPASRRVATAGGPGYDGPAYGGRGYDGPGYDRPGFDGPGRRYPQPPQGYQQQPRQQQWQGPGYGDDDWQRGQYGQDDQGRRDPREGQRGPARGRHGRQDQSGRDQSGQDQYGQDQYGQDQYGNDEYGQRQYRRDQYGRQERPGQGRYQDDQYGRPAQRGQGQYPEDRYTQDQYGRAGQYQQDPRVGQPGRDRGGRDTRDPWAGQSGQGQDPWADQSRQGEDGWDSPDPRGDRGVRDGRGRQPGQLDPRDPRSRRDHRGEPDRRAAAAATGGPEGDAGVAADRRLSTMGNKRAILVGAAQILALLPGISRDGIVTVAGMTRGLSREDAVRFSFLLSAPVILAAGALKVGDLTGPMGKGIHGPVLVGSLIAGIGAYVSIRFLTRYFSENKSLNPFGIYCLIAGLGSLAYLVLK